MSLKEFQDQVRFLATKAKTPDDLVYLLEAYMIDVICKRDIDVARNKNSYTTEITITEDKLIIS